MDINLNHSALLGEWFIKSSLWQPLCGSHFLYLLYTFFLIKSIIYHYKINNPKYSDNYLNLI